MKQLTRQFIFHMVALWLTQQLIPGVRVTNTLISYLSASFVLSLLVLFAKPLLSILFIPINLITFGLLSWVIHVVVIYLLTIFVPSVEIVPWTFSGFTWMGFAIPQFELSYILSLIVGALTITVVTHVLQELT